MCDRNHTTAHCNYTENPFGKSNHFLLCQTIFSLCKSSIYVHWSTKCINKICHSFTGYLKVPVAYENKLHLKHIFYFIFFKSVIWHFWNSLKVKIRYCNNVIKPGYFWHSNLEHILMTTIERKKNLLLQPYGLHVFLSYKCFHLRQYYLNYKQLHRNLITSGKLTLPLWKPLIYHCHSSNLLHFICLYELCLLLQK